MKNIVWKRNIVFERNIVWKRNIVSKRNIALYQKANKKYCIEEKYCRALKGQGEIFYDLEWSKKNIVLKTDLYGREWSRKFFVLKRNFVCYQKAKEKYYIERPSSGARTDHNCTTGGKL